MLKHITENFTHHKTAANNKTCNKNVTNNLTNNKDRNINTTVYTLHMLASNLQFNSDNLRVVNYTISINISDTSNMFNKLVGDYISRPRPNVIAMAVRVGGTTFYMVPFNQPSPKTP